MSDENHEDPELIKRRAAMKSLQTNVDWKLLTDFYAHQSRQIKMKHEALLRQGFSESHALYLCHRNWE